MAAERSCGSPIPCWLRVEKEFPTVFPSRAMLGIEEMVESERKHQVARFQSFLLFSSSADESGIEWTCLGEEYGEGVFIICVG
jgi:hypothetical protein